MAERRMFAKTIIDSDAFLDMPHSTQLLYFHLSMRADDDGFINNPKAIMRNVKCNDDDIKLLITKKFIIPFESGVVVIKHWKIHNYIAKDRYKETKYKEEKASLDLDENNAYTQSLSTTCIQPVYSLDTQDRIGKDRLGKDIYYDSKESSYSENTKTSKFQWLIDAWNELEMYGITPVKRITDDSKRADMIRSRLRSYSKEEVLEAIENIKSSDFLKGNGTNFKVTFDWFIRPNNFPKVLEGNYANRTQQDKTMDILEKFINGD